ncbi:DUF3800 domain-containing protein [Reyranella sp.]|uniref:DUF3800 domain-containing protein n=1 Tax=Reyranella sp. TaxID=1929291 RepID=UPI003D0B081F
MNALLEHVWGASRAADHVWAEVCGLAPGKAVGRLLMIFRAAVDESENRSRDGLFVMGGHVATAEAWAKFSAEWEKMLPAGTRAKNGNMHFKMDEMDDNDERRSRVPWFFRIIEQHVLFSFSCVIDKGDLRRAMGRVWIPDCDIDWGFVANPYKITFRALYDMFHTNRHIIDNVVPSLNEPIDFVFDNRTDAKKEILESWDDYLASRPPETKQFYSKSVPRFLDDQEFVPLQAADFWAWWIRHWAEAGTLDNQDTGDFGYFQQQREGWVKVGFFFTEDELVKDFMKSVRERIEPGRYIYDLRYPRDRTYSDGGMTRVVIRGPSPFRQRAVS